MWLQLLWLVVYWKSPHLFSVVATILYQLDLRPAYLDLLVAFPIGGHRVLQELQSGRRPKCPETIALELLRWLMVALIPSEDHRLAMSGQAYLSLIPGWWMKYLLWFAVCWRSPLALLLNLINLLIEFRLASAGHDDTRI